MLNDKFLTSVVVLSSMLTHPVYAGIDSVDYEHISAIPLRIQQRSRTVLGQRYQYPKGTPALQAYRITIEPGQKTAWHRHSVPLFLNIISGSITVDYGTKGKRIFKKGMSYVEAINWCHQGYANGSQKAIILGLYISDLETDQSKPIDCQGPQ